MSENPSDYVNVWTVNTSNRVPAFLALNQSLEISESPSGTFWLIVEETQKFPLLYNPVNLFMNAPKFSLAGFPLVEYQINFKLALPFSIGRATRTLYCTVQTETSDETGQIQDSEQGVFGAEEDGGGADDDPPINP